MKKALLAALGVLLLIVLTACGGSGSKHGVTLDKEGKKVAANLAKSFTSQSSSSLTATEAKCFSQKFVSSVGVAKLKSAKLINADDEVNPAGSSLSKDISGKFADAFLACVDYQKRQAEQIAKADTKVDVAKLQACLEKEMPESYVKQLIVASQTQSSQSAQLVQESTKKLSECKTSSEKK